MYYRFGRHEFSGWVRYATLIDGGCRVLVMGKKAHAHISLGATLKLPLGRKLSGGMKPSGDVKWIRSSQSNRCATVSTMHWNALCSVCDSLWLGAVCGFVMTAGWLKGRVRIFSEERSLAFVVVCLQFAAMATETMIAELPAQALMGSLPTLLGRYQLTKGEAYAAAREARKVPLLTKERGVALQLELMATYSSPAFQKQLHELGRTLGWLGQHLAVALLIFGTRY